VLKRTLDLLLVLLIAPILVVVCAVLALQVYRDVGSPVFFHQWRAGHHAKLFRLIKFRTMLATTDKSGQLLSDRDRLTPFGTWLRSTSLDELPTFWLVLRGQMSLVGPRPLLAEYLPLYTQEQMRRHNVRPGITGWGQVNGRNELSWEEKFAHDIWYVENRSIPLDIKILFMTVRRVLSRDGVSAAGEATMPRFTGSMDCADRRDITQASQKTPW